MAGEPVELVADSQYVLGIASGEWNPTKNLNHASQLKELASKVGCTFRWVKGHSGDKYNELCDELATKGRMENASPHVVAKWRENEEKRALRKKRKDVKRQLKKAEAENKEADAA